MKIKGTEKVNIIMLMEVIFMEIGIKIKCVEMESFIIQMEESNMMENGKMIYFKEKVYFMLDNVIGSNIKENLRQEKCKDMVL